MQVVLGLISCNQSLARTGQALGVMSLRLDAPFHIDGKDFLRADQKDISQRISSQVKLFRQNQAA